MRIPLYAFQCVHSIVCIPSCVTHYMHSIVDRRRRGEVKEDGGAGTLAHRIYIAVSINRGASTRSVSTGSASTMSASTRLYRSDCMCVVDY